MIKFECQHCGNHLVLSDGFAGRDGWCRVCKRMVIVPVAGGPSRLEDLSPDERFRRLHRLLQFAATKVDKYKRIVLQYDTETHKLHSEIEKVQATHDAFKAAEARLGEAEAAIERVTSQLAVTAQARGDAEAQRDQWAREADRLQSQLQLQKSACAELEAALDEARRQGADAPRLREEIESLAQKREEQDCVVAQLREELSLASQCLGAAEDKAQAETQVAARLTSELSTTRETLDELKRRLADLDAQTTEVAQHTEHDVVLAERLSAEKTEIGRLQGELDRTLAEAQRLAHRGADLERELRSAQEMLETERLTRQSVETALDHARRTTDQSLDELRAEREAHEARMAELEPLRDALTRAEDEVATGSERVAQTATDLEEARSRLGHIQVELQTETEKREAAETSLVQVRRELEQTQALVAELQGELAVAGDARSNPMTVGDEATDSESVVPEVVGEHEDEETEEMMNSFLRFLEER